MFDCCVGTRNRCLRQHVYLGKDADTECELIHVSLLGIAAFGCVVTKDVDDDDNNEQYFDFDQNAWVAVEKGKIESCLEDAEFSLPSQGGSDSDSECEEDEEMWGESVQKYIIPSGAFSGRGETWEKFKEGCDGARINIKFAVLMNDTAVRCIAEHVQSNETDKNLKLVTQHAYKKKGSNGKEGHRFTAIVTIDSCNPTRSGVKCHTVSQLWRNGKTGMTVITKSLNDTTPSNMNCFVSEDNSPAVTILDCCEGDLHRALEVSSDAEELHEYVMGNDPSHTATVPEGQIVGLLDRNMLIVTVDTALPTTLGDKVKDIIQEQDDKVYDTSLGESLMCDNGSFAKHAHSLTLGQIGCRADAKFSA